MRIEIPFSTRQIGCEVAFVATMTVMAFGVVLPGLDLFPVGHFLLIGWVIWRCRWVGSQVLLRAAWTTPKVARPIPDGFGPGDPRLRDRLITWRGETYRRIAHQVVMRLPWRDPVTDVPVPDRPEPNGIILGEGFIWVGDHASAIQRYIHRYKSLPQDPGLRGGSPAIHGAGAARDKPVVLPYGRLPSHVAIEGSTQSGKTVLMAHIARQLIAWRRGAVVLIDPKGSDELEDAARETAERYGRRFGLIRPRTPGESQWFNVISSCGEPTDLPGRLRPLFPEGREAYYKEEPLALLQRVAGMHKALGIQWDIRKLHRDVMDLDSLHWTLAGYLNHLGLGLEGLERDRLPPLSRLKKRYVECGLDDPLVPGVLRPLERTQEAHQDRFGNLDVALSGVVDVKHAALFGAENSLTWDEIDHDEMVMIFRTDSLITNDIGRNIASLFFQDFIGYMGLRYLTNGTRRTPIYIIVDEVGEIVYPDFRQAINKVGEAGGRLFLGWQTKSDLDAELGRFQADVIRANCQSRITMRIADDDTAEALAKFSPRVRMTRPTSYRAMLMGNNAGKGITVEDEDMPLLDANLLLGQPVGQCFLRLDGSLYHINIPR